MLTVTDVSLRFGDRKLLMMSTSNLQEILWFDWGQWCWKINLLKISAGDIEPTTGHISLDQTNVFLFFVKKSL